MKKIVITGGLGYLGTELCKLYSGESWYNKITVIDSAFKSESVSQLRSWGMEFVQASILDNHNKHIDYIIEDNKLKIGKFIPCVNIPIKDKDYCLEHLPQVIIVMAWNFFEEIKKNNRDLIDKGILFISIKDLQNE